MSEAPPSLKSRRTLKLTYEIPVAKTARFWQALKEGQLVTTRCTKCGNVTFPPQNDCPKCLASEPEWIDLGNEAVLESFTQIVVTPVSFVDYEPYVVAVGRLMEGVKILAWLSDVQPEQVKVGMRMKLVARTTPDGRPVYEFKPLQ